jgi:hypothetical protein
MIARMRGRALPVVIAALCVVAGAAADADAKPRKVRIESRPLGATVYINDKEEGPRGETPADLTLEPGTYTVILELNEYDSQFAELVVTAPTRRDKKPIELIVDLKRSMARMQIEGAPPRAEIKVDDLEPIMAGEYEDGFDVTAGGHHIVVEHAGKVLLDEFVEVESSTFKTLTIGRGGGGASTSDGGGGDVENPIDGGEDGGGDGGEDGGDVTERPAPATKRDGPLFSIGPLFEIGFRDFSYRDNATEDMNLPIDQEGEAIFGVALEVNPLRLTDIKALHPLAVLFSAAFGVPQAVAADERLMLGDDLETFWQRFTAGLRYRFGLGSIDLDVEAGYGGYIYRFSGNVNDIERVPDASYQTVRFGGRIGVRLGDGGAYVPYVGGENRIVLSGGALGDRFAGGADTQGYAFRGGVDALLWSGKLATRLEANYRKFDWTFDSQAGDEYDAAGAGDVLYAFSLIIAYSY